MSELVWVNAVSAFPVLRSQWRPLTFTGRIPTGEEEGLEDDVERSEVNAGAFTGG